MTIAETYRIPISAPQTLRGVKSRSIILSWVPTNPEHSQQIQAAAMRMINTWSFAEHERARMLVGLLDAEWTAVARMWDSISGSAARDSMLHAVAHHKFGPVDLDLFKRTETAVRPVRDRRNVYAHHLWAFVAELPEAVVLISQESPLLDAAELEQEWRDSPNVGLALMRLANERLREFRTSMGARDTSDARVYTLGDVEMDIRATEQAHALYYRLAMLAARGSAADGAREQLHKALRVPQPPPPS